VTNNNTATGTGILNLVPRWNNIAVTNAGASAVWVTTNSFAGTPSSSVDGAVEIPPVTTMVLANQLPVWYQSATVLKNNLGFETINTAGMANPGTQVNASGTVTIAGCG